MLYARVKGETDLLCLPSEFFLATAVSATESSDRLAFIGLPLLVTSEGGEQGMKEKEFQLNYKGFVEVQLAEQTLDFHIQTEILC